MEQLIDAVKNWHYDRNLIEGSDEKTQTCKLVSEVGELCDNVAKGKDITDDVGDIMVVLINLTERRGITLYDCLDYAYNHPKDGIKHRKGKMVNGTFVKEAV